MNTMERTIGKIVTVRQTVIRSATGHIIKAKWLPEENDFGKSALLTFVWRFLSIWDALIPDFLRPILELLHLIPLFYFYAGLSDVSRWMPMNRACLGLLCTCLSLYMTMKGGEVVERFNPKNW